VGYGTGIYGLAPLGIAASQASTADPARMSTSRQIDQLTGRFALTTNGAYAGMLDSVQRVVNLTRLALAGRRSIITPDEQEDLRQKIRAALAVMTDPKDPAIELLDIVVSDNGKDAGETQIIFRDLLTNKVQTVRPRGAP
jgi:hypothetical protein